MLKKVIIYLNLVFLFFTTGCIKYEPTYVEPKSGPVATMRVKAQGLVGDPEEMNMIEIVAYVTKLKNCNSVEDKIALLIEKRPEVVFKIPANKEFLIEINRFAQTGLMSTCTFTGFFTPVQDQYYEAYSVSKGSKCAVYFSRVENAGKPNEKIIPEKIEKTNTEYCRRLLQ